MAWSYCTLKITIHSLEYSYILLHNFKSLGNHLNVVLEHTSVTCCIFSLSEITQMYLEVSEWPFTVAVSLSDEVHSILYYTGGSSSELTQKRPVKKAVHVLLRHIRGILEHVLKCVFDSSWGISIGLYWTVYIPASNEVYVSVLFLLCLMQCDELYQVDIIVWISK